ncbi:hypothetical protein [Polluticoccus soli]|uniref:hypothetical protein n=1 Tax=Polluticoccus soli TaxID=3034150 RepID=UPI0023E2C8FF|nr:hypothetical protein [Flavipsychrobacter sp. JY13-12]
MSANQSNLSDPKYGYDMVVATTQASVNATMQEWLSKYTGAPFTQAYVYDPTHQYSPNGIALTDFEQLKKDVGFDPFTIPDKTATTDQRIAKLLDKKFMFAFQIEIGMPDFPAEKIPPVIQFNKEGSYVTYNMVCKTFKIIVIEPGLYGPASWINLSQDTADAPWVFSFTIDLDLRNDNINNHFSTLPPETQREIKNLGQDMFSVQQLFLDLNAAGLSDSITISGLDKTSQAYMVLTQVFLNKYLADIAKNGGIMLGYSVVSQQPFPQNVSIIPTNLNFEISSYKDAKGQATADYPAYTLNYLIMSKGRPMPSPTQFAWNWVEKDQTTQYAGVMSVNRGTFIQFLHDILSPSLRNLAKVPGTSYSVNCIKCSFGWNYNTDQSAQAFNIVQNGGSHVLTYSYSKSSSSSDSIYCGLWGVWGNIGADYSVQSDVYLQGTTIRIETTLTMHMHLNVCGGVTDGNFVKKKLVDIYTIGVDAQGRISVSQATPQITDMSDAVNPDGWSKFVTLGQINSAVDNVKNSVTGWIDGFLASDSATIAATLNGSNGWVFPGGKTYSFLNAQFSDAQDLVANVLYIAPTATKAERAALLKGLPVELAKLVAPAKKATAEAETELA